MLQKTKEIHKYPKIPKPQNPKTPRNEKYIFIIIKIKKMENFAHISRENIRLTVDISSINPWSSFSLSYVSLACVIVLIF